MTRWPAIWISDVHLGARAAQIARLIAWLDANRTDRLYIVGDLFDGLHAVRLRDLLEVLGRIARAPKVVFVPGNHDCAFRRCAGDFGWLTICPEAVHVARDGRRYLVTHGDEFEGARSETLDAIGSSLNSIARRIASATRSRWFDRKIDAATRGLNALTTGGRLDCRLVGLCAVGDLDGVITGHFHSPGVRALTPTLLAADCGDWLTHCSAIVESDAGRLELRFAA